MQERILLERAKAEAENEAASLKKELKNPWAKLKDRIRKLKDEKHALKQVSRGVQAPDSQTLNPKT